MLNFSAERVDCLLDIPTVVILRKWGFVADLGYTYGPPLAVSPLNEVRRVLDYAVTEIPPEKILMGMPNYGYDWMLPYASGTAARTVGFVEAIELAQRFGSEIIFDERSQTPYFNYVENGVRHVVWFDDPRSISDKDCTKQLATLTTDNSGNTDIVEVKAGTVYIKELSVVTHVFVGSLGRLSAV